MLGLFFCAFRSTPRGSGPWALSHLNPSGKIFLRKSGFSGYLFCPVFANSPIGNYNEGWISGFGCLQFVSLRGEKQDALAATFSGDLNFR
ncbi:hypothetical protein Pr1d_19570 [Bythopirellula goksoeyrii]|uniref:Uncharacterized protein n=1 Tax=Bythopirellula goksoeyrii TaxID=1400387 RepID=A0A5B9QAK7_9BACT|nr:hypothetical protein Pr1d_19570 [Bythopirellula goksoeyrii]